MNTLVYEFVDEIDREITEAEMAFEVSMRETDYLMEMVSVKNSLNMARAEQKVLLESGTYDDLTVLYEEANGEATEKQKGIIATIIEKILGFITDIFTAIGKLFSAEKKKELEAAAAAAGNVEVEVAPTKLEAIKKTFTDGISLITKICKHQATQEEVDKFVDGAKKVAIVGAVAGAAVGGAIAVKTVSDKKKKQKVEDRNNRFHVANEGGKRTVISAPSLLNSAYSLGTVGGDLSNRLKSVDSMVKNSNLNPQESGWVKNVLDVVGKVPGTFAKASREWMGVIRDGAVAIKNKISGKEDKTTVESVLGYNLENEEFLESVSLDQDYEDIAALFEAMGC